MKKNPLNEKQNPNKKLLKATKTPSKLLFLHPICYFSTQNIFSHNRIGQIEIATENTQDLNKANQTLKNKYNELDRKYWDLKKDKEAQERMMSESIRAMQDQILSKRQEMDNFQMNIESGQDLEFEKMKLKNELELTYMKELDAKEALIEALKDKINKLEKDLVLLESKTETKLRENEKSSQVLKETHEKQTNSLLNEIASLQERLSFNDREQELRALKLKNDQLEAKSQQMKRELVSVREDLEAVQNKKNQIMMDNLKEIEGLRSRINEFNLQSDQLSLKNDLLKEENSELLEKLKQMEADFFNAVNLRKELEDTIEQKKRILEDMEEDMSKQRERHSKQILEKNKEQASRENRLQDKLAHLGSELTTQKHNFEKLRELYEERLDGVKTAGISHEKKNHRLMDSIDNLNQKINNLEAALDTQKKLNLGLRKHNDKLGNENLELKSRQKAMGKDLEIYREAEKTGGFVSDKEKANLQLNTKMISELKALKVQNINLQKVNKRLNKKLVDTIAKKLIKTAEAKRVKRQLPPRGPLLTDQIARPFSRAHSAAGGPGGMIIDPLSQPAPYPNIFAMQHPHTEYSSLSGAPSFHVSELGYSQAQGFPEKAALSEQERKLVKDSGNVSFKGEDSMKVSTTPEEMKERIEQLAHGSLTSPGPGTLTGFSTGMVDPNGGLGVHGPRNFDPRVDSAGFSVSHTYHKNRPLFTNPRHPFYLASKMSDAGSLERGGGSRSMSRERDGESGPPVKLISGVDKPYVSFFSLFLGRFS